MRQRGWGAHVAALASLDGHLHWMMHQGSTISDEVLGSLSQGVEGGV